MLRLVLLLVFSATASGVYADRLAPNFEPASRSEFVSGLVAIGMKQLSATELETPGGYRLDLAPATEFQVLWAWLAQRAFFGTFCSEGTAYEIVTFDNPDDELMSMLRANATRSRRHFGVIERVGELALSIDSYAASCER